MAALMRDYLRTRILASPPRSSLRNSGALRMSRTTMGDCAAVSTSQRATKRVVHPTDTSAEAEAIFSVIEPLLDG
jgi:hypothetical protein